MKFGFNKWWFGFYGYPKKRLMRDSVVVYAGEEDIKEEGDSGVRGDLIPRVVAGTNLRRWKHDHTLYYLSF